MPRLTGLSSGALLFAALCLGGAGWPEAIADDKPDPQGIAFFEDRIRPVLVEHCYSCHASNAKKIRGGLTLDSRDALRKGGDSGPALTPGDAAGSLLIESLRYESYEMPPKGKLPDPVIADFVSWVEMGAPDPREQPAATPPATSSGIDIDEGREFWCFRPPQMPDVPTSAHDGWCRSEIDQFIAARWEVAGLSPAQDADRRTLIRRATFDLIGLPPTPAEIDAFLADPDTTPAAFVKVVDRLLESPQFGERWGRHWLDVARYSESTGGGRSMLFGDAWRYRDYVIASFNNDKPFDRFILEQLAGDLLPADDTLQQREQLIATAFLALGPTNYEQQDKLQLEMDVIDEQVDTVGRAFLGMTIGCARCHDHKFDPIPTADYYALAGIFRSTHTLIHDNVSKWVTRPLPLDHAAQQHLDEYQQQTAALEQTIKQQTKLRDKLRSRLPIVTLDDEGAVTITGNWTTSSYTKGFVGEGYRHATGEGAAITYTFPVARSGLYEVRVSWTPGENRSPNALFHIQHREGEASQRIDQRKAPPLDGQFVSLGTYEFADSAEIVLSTEGTTGVVIADAVQLIALTPIDEPSKADAEPDLLARLTSLEEELAGLQAQVKLLKENAPPPAPVAIVVQEAADELRGDFHICIRGNPKNHGPAVPRGFLQVALLSDAPEIPASSSGRLELARWIGSRDNPLTVRVAVNRIWHHLFGTGLVRTVDNVGLTGERPSHPELLDHLALRFVDTGWSVKGLIREIMLTRVYQLSSDASDAAHHSDPENRLLAHFPRRRLDSEAIYDAILALSGDLDLSVEGNTVRPQTTSEYGYEFDVGRRAVYLPVFRNRLPDLFTVFDFPDPNQSLGRRNVSTLSTQALFLMNSPFVMDQSRRVAERLLADPEINDDTRLDRLYALAIGRLPTDEERRLSQEFLTAGREVNADTQLAHWTGLCQAVIASIDFRYVQ